MTETGGVMQITAIADRPVRPPRPHAASAEELAAHAALLATISNPLWGLAG
jgi:DNA polymerase III subunit epsilon